MSLVSIVLPTFNRAAFLPHAVASIRSQTLQDWHLIVVDDGSTDNTADVLRRLAADLGTRVTIVRQDNRGAYAARNTGLDHVDSRFVALFDSDDVWLPEYLATCVAALEANADVDWVYAACRIVDLASGATVSPDTFVLDGAPRPFRRLRSHARKALNIIDDPDTVSVALRHGLYCGLQNSVIRNSVFVAQRFHTPYRNEAEDQLFVIRALKHGFRFGYINSVLVQYHVHDANSSAAAVGQTAERQRTLLELLIRGFEDLRTDVALTREENRVLAQRLLKEYFWHLGYAMLLKSVNLSAAKSAFRRGLREWPWSLRCWKTYAIAEARSWMNRESGGSVA